MPGPQQRVHKGTGSTSYCRIPNSLKKATRKLTLEGSRSSLRQKATRRAWGRGSAACQRQAGVIFRQMGRDKAVE